MAVFDRGQQTPPSFAMGAYQATIATATAPRAVPINSTLIEADGCTLATQAGNQYVLGTGWADGTQVMINLTATGLSFFSPANTATTSLSTATGPWQFDATGEVAILYVFNDNWGLNSNRGMAAATVAIFATAT